jgi:hypothetical protein
MSEVKEMYPGKVSNETDAEREIRLGVDAQRRAQNCMIDIKNTLNKWKCQIEPMIQISGSGIVKGNFMVVPLIERPVG